MIALAPRLPARLSALLRSPGLVSVLLVGVTVALWAASIIGDTATFTVSLDDPAARSTATSRLAGLIPGGTSVADGSMELRVDGLPWYLRLLTTLSVTLGLLALVAAIWLAAPVGRAIRSGRPFEGQVYRRLYWSAGLAMVVGVALPTADALVSFLVLSHLGAPAGPALDPGIHLHGGWFALALLLQFAAEAAAHGKRLADELEGLV